VRECNAKVMPQKITLTLRPEAAFEMPYSEGYQLYSALPGVMQEADCAMARHTHDSPISSISLRTKILNLKSLHTLQAKRLLEARG
jgi:hypothetical protein